MFKQLLISVNIQVRGNPSSVLQDNWSVNVGRGVTALSSTMLFSHDCWEIRVPFILTTH